jgi:hypothetical protein
MTNDGDMKEVPRNRALQKEMCVRSLGMLQEGLNLKLQKRIAVVAITGLNTK